MGERGVRVRRIGLMRGRGSEIAGLARRLRGRRGDLLGRRSAEGRARLPRARTEKGSRSQRDHESTACPVILI
jgi:hypothetical protein